jgi:Nucleotidyl transferase AbiEii toxin, Type IV TA system
MAGVVPRRIHLVVAIDRLLARLLQAAPGQWVVKGGYANQLRRPDDARFTEDLDVRIDAAIETSRGAARLGVSGSISATTSTEKVHARTLPCDVENTRARDLVDLCLTLEDVSRSRSGRNVSSRSPRLGIERGRSEGVR